MPLLQRVRWTEVQWLPFIMALVLTGFGLSFVISATMDPASPSGWGREAEMQLIWWGLALGACAVCVHLPLSLWRDTAIPMFIACLLLQVFMFLAAGSTLVPTIKGAHNWIAVGSLRVQPSEFYKIASLLVTARMLTNPAIDIRQFSWSCMVAAVGCLPALLIAKEDLGSALTFGPMVFGMLLLAGMPLRHLAIYLALVAFAATLGVMALPEDSYHIRRLHAWLNPEDFADTQGYQTIRSLRSIGSGQWLGKGYGVGDQNLLGWLPEKHTDMIFAVVGEELGFLGAALVPILFCAFGWACLFAAARCRVPYGRLVITGFGCLVVGQAFINLAVVTGMMPVTGITLPFFSYGGSSLLGTYIALGIVMSASLARQRQLGASQYL